MTLNLLLWVAIACVICTSIGIAFGRAWGGREERDRNSAVMAQLLEEARAANARSKAMAAEVQRLHTMHVTGRRAGRA